MSDVVADRPDDEDEVVSLLLDQDDVDWNSVLRELVREHGLDPWDVDISVVSNKFLDVIDDMREENMRISGKMVRAASFFLKLKSDKLLEEDLQSLDTMMMEPDELYDDLEEPEEPAPLQDVNPALVPKTPQPRKRKVSVQDLANALESALEKEQRNYLRRVESSGETRDEAEDVNAPDEQRDIEAIINDVYETVKSYLTKAKQLTFNALLASETKEEKVDTLIPLLHLDNQGEIHLHQEEPFEDIHVREKTRGLDE